MNHLLNVKNLSISFSSAPRAPEVVSGVCAEEALAQFRAFFKEVRKKNKKGS